MRFFHFRKSVMLCGSIRTSPRRRRELGYMSDASETAPSARFSEGYSPELESALAQLTAGEREVVAVLRDVSERKTQERALEIARSESDRSNRSSSPATSSTAKDASS